MSGRGRISAPTTTASTLIRWSLTACSLLALSLSSELVCLHDAACRGPSDSHPINPLSAQPERDAIRCIVVLTELTMTTEKGAAGLVGLQEVREAAERIAGKAHRTPIVTCTTIDDLAGRRVYFKCENLQKV